MQGHLFCSKMSLLAPPGTFYVAMRLHRPTIVVLPQFFLFFTWPNATVHCSVTPVLMKCYNIINAKRATNKQTKETTQCNDYMTERPSPSLFYFSVKKRLLDKSKFMRPISHVGVFVQCSTVQSKYIAFGQTHKFHAFSIDLPPIP